MATLPEEIFTTVFNLQRQLLARIDEATALGLTIFEQLGETDLTLPVLEQLDNVKERTTSSSSRLYTLLVRISESQPTATSAILNLLDETIEQAEATNAASQATIQETKRDLDLL